MCFRSKRHFVWQMKHSIDWILRQINERLSSCSATNQHDVLSIEQLQWKFNWTNSFSSNQRIDGWRRLSNVSWSSQWHCTVLPLCCTHSFINQYEKLRRRRRRRRRRTQHFSEEIKLLLWSSTTFTSFSPLINQTNSFTSYRHSAFLPLINFFHLLDIFISEQLCPIPYASFRLKSFLQVELIEVFPWSFNVFIQ